MKKAELEKSRGLKIQGQMRQAPIPSRFGAAALPDRKEQRKLDQAAGLVPYAVKLPQALVDRLREMAMAQGTGLNELTAGLLQAAMGGALAGDAGQKPAKAGAESATEANTAAKKVAKTATKTAADTGAKVAASKTVSAKTATKKTTAAKSA